MNESAEQSFSQYWAAKRGVATYGVSEFEDEPSFAAARTNSASSAVNATIVSPADVYANASQACPHFFRVAVGSGKTHIAVEYIVKLFRVLPASDINATR